MRDKISRKLKRAQTRANSAQTRVKSVDTLETEFEISPAYSPLYARAHTYTHTHSLSHTHREREREREKYRSLPSDATGSVSPASPAKKKKQGELPVHVLSSTRRRAHARSAPSDIKFSWQSQGQVGTLLYLFFKVK
jgi:hypothetical protein